MTETRPADTDSGLVPRDEFSAELRSLRGHPEHVEKNSRVEVHDFYGNVVTYNVKTISRDGKTTLFLEKGTAGGGMRLMLPPEVMTAVYRQRDGATEVRRSRAGKKAAATRALAGVEPFKKRQA